MNKDHWQSRAELAENDKRELLEAMQKISEIPALPAEALSIALAALRHH